MIEKDVEYNLKNSILNCDSSLAITNEFLSDGIVRKDGTPVGLLEFKIKRDFSKDKTLAQVLCQAMCYYYKILQKEKTVNTNKPFYLLIGDENEIAVFDIHKIPSNWLMNRKWGEIAPSKACKEEELFKQAESVVALTPPIYYKYASLEELKFGLMLLFSICLG